MNTSQKIVALGAASGVVSMAILVSLLHFFLPSSSDLGLAERIALTLQLNVLAALPLFIGIITVGNSRFLSDAIDPLKHKEDKMLEVNGRFVDNTLQQNFFFLLGTLALATLLPSEQMNLIGSGLSVRAGSYKLPQTV